MNIENATQFYNLVKPYNHHAFQDYCLYFEKHILGGCQPCKQSRMPALKQEAEGKYMVTVTLNHAVLTSMATEDTLFYSSGNLFYQIKLK